MKNADQPAMPMFDSDGYPKVESGTYTSGLTKREMITMHIMSGLVADGATTFEGGREAKCAVRWADALLAELEATK